MSSGAEVARVVLCGIFLLAGLAKWRDPSGTLRAVQSFGVSGRLARPATAFLPVVEVLTGALLAVPATSRVGAVAAVLLLWSFSIAIARTLARGSAPTCGCFGRRSERAISARSLQRNLGLASLAVIVLWRPETWGLSLALLTVAGASVALAARRPAVRAASVQVQVPAPRQSVVAEPAILSGSDHRQQASVGNRASSFSLGVAAVMAGGVGLFAEGAAAASADDELKALRVRFRAIDAALQADAARLQRALAGIGSSTSVTSAANVRLIKAAKRLRADAAHQQRVLLAVNATHGDTRRARAAGAHSLKALGAAVHNLERVFGSRTNADAKRYAARAQTSLNAAKAARRQTNMLLGCTRGRPC